MMRSDSRVAFGPRLRAPYSKMTKKTSRGLSLFWVVLTVVLAVSAGLAGARWMHERAVQSVARNTVVWISIDGLRGDYVRRGELPFFAHLLREAATTSRLRPAFPSTTFPSHSAEATGVSAELHGITGNSFYDAEKKLQFNYPGMRRRCCKSSPSGLTAQRQGVRTAVYDWPLSFAQKGGVRTEIFLEAFDANISDEMRLSRLLDGWSQSLDKPNSVPLHLLMGYVVATDKPGHVFGPDAPEILQEMTTLDAQLADFSSRVQEIWRRQRRSPKDRLFVIFSTDHGMSPVHHIVSAERLLGIGRHDPDFPVTTRRPETSGTSFSIPPCFRRAARPVNRSCANSLKESPEPVRIFVPFVVTSFPQRGRTPIPRGPGIW